MSATEFMRWRFFLEEEYNTPSQETYHLANLAKEVFLLRWTVANLLNKDAREPKVEMKEYLVRFESRESEILDEEEVSISVKVPPDWRVKMELSKGAWLVGCGLVGKAFKTKKPPPKPGKGNENGRGTDSGPDVDRRQPVPGDDERPGG